MLYSEFVALTHAHTERAAAALLPLANDRAALVQAIVKQVRTDYAPGGLWTQMLDGGEWALHPHDYVCELLPDGLSTDDANAVAADVWAALGDIPVPSNRATVQIKLSATIRREWQTRCIADVIPGLSTWSDESEIEVSESTALEIAEDCRFYINPKAVDATAAERSAYRALLRQIENHSRK